eukprot:jgi/Tetstr1/433971/TSEL_023148.t1
MRTGDAKTTGATHPGPLLPELVQKLHEQSGAAATVVAPRWDGKAWHHALTEMAVEELTAPRAGLFRPGRRDGRDMIGMPHWPAVTVFRVPYGMSVPTPRGRECYAIHVSGQRPSTPGGMCMKQYVRFCGEEEPPALAADPGTMAARYVTWLGNMGTIKASNMQPNMSAVNNFFKDHGREPKALSDLVGRVR